MPSHSYTAMAMLYFCIVKRKMKTNECLSLTYHLPIT